MDVGVMCDLNRVIAEDIKLDVQADHHKVIDSLTHVYAQQKKNFTYNGSDRRSRAPWPHTPTRSYLTSRTKCSTKSRIVGPLRRNEMQTRHAYSLVAVVEGAHLWTARYESMPRQL